MPDAAPRPLDARAATWLGIGAIVGGGSIVLAGPAFAVAGPSALIAIALNAALAALAALALAELGARFPRSGGPYVFAQRVLGVEAAFAVGWLVVFASLAAAAVFAEGFASFAVPILASTADALGFSAPDWATGNAAETAVALAAVATYGQRLSRRADAPAAFLTVAKVVGMGALGAIGLVALGVRPEAMSGFLAPPLAPGGVVGVVQAMGVLFIAFQGFAIVPALAGDVRDPARTLPRASLTAIAVAMVLYLPLFLATATAGLPDGTALTDFALATDATMVAVGTARYLGDVGYVWVAVVAILATLTALEANLLGASRLARTMARDRTLPRALARVDARGVPRRAVGTATAFVAVLVVALSEVRTAGAAAGLIYLTVFALAHGLALLVRQRRPDGAPPYGAPGAPATLWLGGLAAAAVAVVNAVSVPAAGVAVLGWLLLGSLVFIAALRRQARALDAELTSTEPDVVSLRGRRPLVLAPVANPANAEGLVSVAHALAPPDAGRVTLLNVVPHGDAAETGLANAQRVLGASLRASLGLGLTPQALTTVADDAWDEIARVARTLDCESLLLGLSDLNDAATLERVDALIAAVRSDVVVLRAPEGWHLERCRKVVVPFAGRSDQERVRARVLGSLARLTDPDVALVRLLPPDADAERSARALRDLEHRVEHRQLGRVRCLATPTDDPVGTLAAMAAEADLLLLGMPRRDAQHRALGSFAHAVAAATPASCAVLLIHARG